MASGSDTLNISSLRLRKKYPLGEVGARPRPADPEHHPDAARLARERIAALPDAFPLAQISSVPGMPTADLVTDRTKLAEGAGGQPGVVQAGKRKLPPAAQPILTAAGIFVLTLLLFKAPIIISQLQYSLGHKNSQPAAAAVTTNASVPAADTISIPKINVNAPVVYQPSVDETAIENSLENGVVHYGNTAVPGQVGNVAIFGHSSNDWWEPGNYKFVFVLLDKLAPGDQVTIDYNSQRYVYQVTGSQVVDPTDVGVLNPTSTPTLTLITCTPPGTSLRRLVVTARQISPDPNSATSTPTPTPASTANSNLPSSAPDFLTQLSQAWHGITQGFSSLFGADSSNPSPSASPGTATGQIPAVK